MSRVCVRPGCGEMATATFVFSAPELTVWMGDLSDDRRSTGHDLCSEHAERLTVPTGWTLTDARNGRTPLTEAPPTSPMLARAFRSAQAS